MGFIFGIAFIGLIVVYGFWLYKAIRDLIPRIKHRFSEFKAKKQKKNQTENNLTE